jgi:predicted CoA-substrate-specific enzyme activase
MAYCGIDVGSVTTDAVLIDDAGRVLAAVVLATGARHGVAAEQALAAALCAAGLRRDEVRRLVSTGYGRRNVTCADREVTEITCHARGAAALFPGVELVIDIGGQDSKVIRVEAGRMVQFAMNDKCAAGTGRFLEVMARTLEVEIGELAGLSARSRRQVAISSMCTVFAESEVISRIAEGCAREDIARGIHTAIAERVYPMIAHVGQDPYRNVVMTGGVAKNDGVREALEQRLRCAIAVPPEPQVVGALGAALVAREDARRARAGEAAAGEAAAGEAESSG